MCGRYSYLGRPLLMATLPFLSTLQNHAHNSDQKPAKKKRKKEDRSKTPASYVDICRSQPLSALVF